MIDPRCAAGGEATPRKVYKEMTRGASITDCRAYLQCALALGGNPSLRPNYGETAGRGPGPVVRRDSLLFAGWQDVGHVDLSGSSGEKCEPRVFRPFPGQPPSATLLGGCRSGDGTRSIDPLARW